MKQSSLACRVRSAAWKLALVAGFTPGAVWAQEDCEVDADCGHGFQCVHTSAGTSSVVTGSGGSTAVECGDGICEGGAEDPDSCPQDCDTIQYCAPAECDANADCAEGYECGEEVGASSSFTGAGGTTASVCGDDTCDIDENSESCPDDCAAIRYCQVVQMQCTSDDDCADGFYCYFESSETSATAVSVSSVDSGTDGSDTTTDGASSDSGSGGTDSGFAPPADTSGATSGGNETGVCVAGSSDSGGSNDVGTGGGSVDAGSSGSTDDSGTGADTSSSAANGAGGAGTTLGEGSPATGSDGDSSGSGNDATASDGGGAGGSDPSGDEDESDGDDGGCSCAIVATPPASGFLTAVLLGVAAAIRRRRMDRS